jgi:hypothetical protein
VIRQSIELAALLGSRWLKSAYQVDKEMASLPAKSYELEFKTTDLSTSLEFPGVAYEITDSRISGSRRITYHPEKPETWNVPLYQNFKASLMVDVPSQGYYVSAGYSAPLISKLRTHQVSFEITQQAHEKEFHVYRAQQAEFSSQPSEGHQTLKVKGSWKKEKRLLPAGSLFIPIHQKYAALVMALMEPESKDSYLYWGFFNTAFEKKEYLESYVAETVAVELLKNPEIQKEFEAKLKDETFRKDPQARLEFFYRKHPSWDERYQLAPVYKN